MEITKLGTPEDIYVDFYKVAINKNPYYVAVSNDYIVACSCPDYYFHQQFKKIDPNGKRNYCKHMIEVEKYLSPKGEIDLLDEILG